MLGSYRSVSKSSRRFCVALLSDRPDSGHTCADRQPVCEQGQVVTRKKLAAMIGIEESEESARLLKLNVFPPTSDRLLPSEFSPTVTLVTSSTRPRVSHCHARAGVAAVSRDGRRFDRTESETENHERMSTGLVPRYERLDLSQLAHVSLEIVTEAHRTHLAVCGSLGAGTSRRNGACLAKRRNELERSSTISRRIRRQLHSCPGLTRCR